MAIRVRVVVSPNWFKIALIRKEDIKFEGRSLHPTGIHLLQNAAGAAGVVGGAVLGGLLAGGVGALVGAMAGGKGRTVFVIETREGKKLVCSCKNSEFAGIYVVINALMEFHPMAPAELGGSPRSFSWFYAIVFGPFYMARYGIVAFLVGMLLVCLSFGMLWPFLSMGSMYLQRRLILRGQTI